MTDRFELEQQILGCWHVVDDIKALTDYNDNIGSMTPEQLTNYLKGLEAIYQVKFERLFDTFEKCIHGDVFFKPGLSDDE